MPAKAQTQYDKMTETPIPRLILMLSVPTIISMLVTNAYNLVDTAFVGTLGTSASGAVGIVFGFMSILQAIGFMFGQGGGSILSRKLGQKDIEGASVVASTSCFWSFTLSVCVSLLSAFFMNPLVHFLGSTDTIAPYAKTYITYIILTAPFVVSSFTMNNVLRYEGKAFYGMIGLLTGALLNIGGDALLMKVFHMGIAGAGLSTAISQVVSFIVLLTPFLRGQTEVKLSFSKISFRFREFLDITSTGFPSMLRQGLNSLSTILLNMEASVYQDAAVSGMSIVSRIFFFIFAVSIGIGQGFQPVSGFNFGAGKYKRVRQGFLFTFFFSEVMMLILGSAVFWNADDLVSLLRNDPQVIVIGARSLRLHCIAVLFLPLCMVTEMLLQSTGHRLQASIVSSMRSGVIFIPALLILSSLRGLAGIQEAQPLTFILSFIPAAYFAVKFFRRYR